MWRGWGSFEKGGRLYVRICVREAAVISLSLSAALAFSFFHSFFRLFFFFFFGGG